MNKPHGILGLYQGFGLSVAGIIPYRAIYFGMYDSLAVINPYRKYNSIIRFFSSYVIAHVTIMTASYVSYPFDTIRRRLQMQAERPKEQWLYRGIVNCFFKVIKEEGVGTLFRSAGSNALRTLGSALVLVMYDEMKTMLGFRGVGGGKACMHLK